jgi:prepilin-type N-terminal cleavage/methylation domain-containing protein
MLKRIREARQNEDGFTLIELLLVIIILGVLAGIVVFAVRGINDRGNVSACRADKKNVEIASEAYYSKNFKYATSINGDFPDTVRTPPTDLVHSGFLREQPAGTGYTITYTETGGIVSADLC